MKIRSGRNTKQKIHLQKKAIVAKMVFIHCSEDALHCNIIQVDEYINGNQYFSRIQKEWNFVCFFIRNLKKLFRHLIQLKFNQSGCRSRSCISTNKSDNGRCFVVHTLATKKVYFSKLRSPHIRRVGHVCQQVPWHRWWMNWNGIVPFYHQISCRGWAKDVSIRDEQLSKDK